MSEGALRRPLSKVGLDTHSGVKGVNPIGNIWSHTLI